MKQLNRKFSLSLMVGLLGGISVAYAGSTITSIDFQAGKDASEIQIRSDGPVTFEKQESAGDNQLILELKGATIGKNASRKLDTTSFDSKVSLVSPYQVEGQSDTARVVVQLKNMVQTDVSQDGNLIRIKVPNGGESSQAQAAPPPAPAPLDSAPAAPNQQAPAAAATAGATAPPDRSKSNLDEFMQTMETKRFTGRPITLQLRDADLMDVFRLIGDTSGFNIVIGDDVKGKITLSLNDVPWDQALDMILHTQHLGAERNHNLLRIATLSSLTQEKQQELAATLAAQTSAPRVTRVFPISYANLGDLTTILTKFGGVATNSAGQSNIVQSDSRTNSIIVRDTPENIERMKRLIELLDTQTPQVLVESKIIEATEGFTRSVGGNLGLGFVPSATDGIPIQATTSFAGGNPVDQLIGSPGVFSTGASSASGGNGGNMGFSFGISPGIRLNAILNFAEHEENIKVITTPKTVVLNKQSASILQSQPVVINVTTTIPGGGSTQTPTTLNANINLTVTPTVTNEGSVLMDLNVERDVPQAQSVASRNIKTQVLVESGATLVIGGIYTLQNNKTSDGFPFLHKIPILGWLFGSDSDATSRSELMIFVTPRILNPKEAGLTS